MFTSPVCCSGSRGFMHTSSLWSSTFLSFSLLSSYVSFLLCDEFELMEVLYHLSYSSLSRCCCMHASCMPKFWLYLVSVLSRLYHSHLDHISWRLLKSSYRSTYRWTNPHFVLPLHELQTDIIGHTLHWSYVVRCVPGIMIMSRSKEKKGSFWYHVEACQILDLLVCTWELWIQAWWDNRHTSLRLYSSLQWHLVLLEDCSCILDGAWCILVRPASWMHGHYVGIFFLSNFSVHPQTQCWVFILCQFVEYNFINGLHILHTVTPSSSNIVKYTQPLKW